MKSFRILLAILTVAVTATHPAFAGPHGGGAPEIDPSMGLGALAFLGGTLMVIRGRIKR